MRGTRLNATPVLEHNVFTAGSGKEAPWKLKACSSKYVAKGSLCPPPRQGKGGAGWGGAWKGAAHPSHLMGRGRVFCCYETFLEAFRSIFVAGTVLVHSEENSGH